MITIGSTPETTTVRHAGRPGRGRGRSACAPASAAPAPARPTAIRLQQPARALQCRMTALLDQIPPGPRHAIQAQLFELFVQLTHDRPPARQCLCAGCRSAPCRPGRLATSGHIELREPSCPSVPADVCQNGQMIQNKDCVLTDGLLFRNWTRVRFRVPPPIKSSTCESVSPGIFCHCAKIVPKIGTVSAERISP